MKAALIAAVLAAVLTGCAAPRTITLREVEVRYDAIPAELLECAAEPESLAAGATLRDLALWADAQRSAARDCRAKIGAVRQWDQSRRAAP